MRSVYPNGQGFMARGPRDNVRLTVAARTFTNLGAAETEVSNADRQTVDLSLYSVASLVCFVQVMGNTGLAKVQYSLDNSAWSDLTGTVSLGTTGMKRSAATSIPVAARTIVNVRLVGLNGDTAEDPVVGTGATLELS